MTAGYQLAGAGPDGVRVVETSVQKAKRVK